MSVSFLSYTLSVDAPPCLICYSSLAEDAVSHHRVGTDPDKKEPGAQKTDTFHHMCRKCARSWLRIKPICPACKLPVSNMSAFFSFRERAVNWLRNAIDRPVVIADHEDPDVDPWGAEAALWIAKKVIYNPAVSYLLSIPSAATGVVFASLSLKEENIKDAALLRMASLLVGAAAGSFFSERRRVSGEESLWPALVAIGNAGIVASLTLFCGNHVYERLNFS